ncbi:MAG: hypothetical protein RIF33_15930 [Cyclobacteriaceae bacterium]
MKLRPLLYLPLFTILILGLTCCTPEQDTGIAPSRQFVKYYGLNALDEGIDIIYDDGDLIVLGERNTIGEANNSIILYRMDSAGNELAKNVVGEAGFLYTAQKIVKDADGFVIGGTRTTTTEADIASFMFTLKVNDALEPVDSWGVGGFRTYGADDSLAYDRPVPNHRLFDLAVREDGFAMIGTTNDVETDKVNPNSVTDISDVAFYLLDGGGAVTNSLIYGYVGRDEGHSIIPTGNDNFAVMGMTNRSAFGGDDTQLGGNNILFNILDGEGQVKQNKIYGSTSSGGGVNVDDAPVVMVQDGLGFAGMANDGASNAIMIRLTSTGQLIALSNLDLDLAEQSSISTSLIRTFRGDYIITGSVNTRADTETSVDRGTDMLVMNVNQDFTINTNRVYNYGGEENDVSNGIVQLPSSNLVILGTTDFENGNTMITLMKTNATGRFIGN